MPQNIKARAGAGSSLSIGNGGSPETFTPIGQILPTLKWSGAKIKTADTTNQDSLADGNSLIWEEMIPTIVSGGTVDLEVNYVPADVAQRALLAAFDGKPHNFVLATPLDPASSPKVPFASFGFSGYLFDRPDIDLPLDKQMKLSIKIAVVGPPSPIVYSS